jgi:hypothetical protein
MIALSLVGCQDGGGAASSAGVDSSDPAQQLSVPSGMRLVGMNGIAVAVPDSWGIDELRCGTPDRDTVVFDQAPGLRIVAACAISMPGVSAAHFSDVSYWRQSNRASGPDSKTSPGATLGGTATRRTKVVELAVCLGGFPQHSSCQVYKGSLLVPSHDLAVSVQSPKRAVVASVLSSARLIPATFTAVPDLFGMSIRKAQVAGQHAHLRLRTGPCLRHASPPVGACRHADFIISTTPPAGSVVPQGSTVVLQLPHPLPSRPK